MPLDHQRLKSLFLAAIEQPDAARGEFVRAQAGDDQELCEAALDLLRHHDGSRADVVLPGTTLAGDGFDALPAAIGPWRPVALLGRGGMGVVYRAVRDSDGLEAALKLVATGRWSPVLLRRFDREIQALRRLDHPGIARLLDHGSFAFAGGELPYLAVELVAGDDLRVAASRLPALRDKVELLVRVCRAIGHAHARGVVHRDLKPENLLVEADASPKVLDFGVAGLRELEVPDGVPLTRTGLLLGTPQYMSPEQAIAAAGTVGPASDVYSLGVIAYELLGGRLPYDVREASLHRAMVAILTVEPPPLGWIAPELSGDLEHILERALEKRPEDRYRDANQLADELQAWLDGRPARARPSWRGRLARTVRRHTRAIRIGSLLAAGVVVIVVALFAGRLIDWRNDRTLSQLSADAVDASDVIHRDTRNPESVRSAQQVFERFEHALELDQRSWAPTVRRWVHFRIAECEMILFEFDQAPGRLPRAIHQLELARIQFQLPTDPSVPIGSITFRTGLLGDPKRSDVISLEAGAYSESGRLAKPLTNYRFAESRCRDALDVTRDEYRAGRFGSAPDTIPVMLGRRNAYAEVLVELGALSDSMAYLDRGLEISRAVSREGGIQGDGMFQGAVYQNLGIAFLRVAERTRQAALFDSARAGYRMAASIRTLSRPFHFASSRMGIVETELEEAIASSAPGEGARHLDNARLEIGLIRELVPPADLRSLTGRLNGLEAEVLARLVIAGGDRALLERADHLLADSLNVMPASNLVGTAWLEYRRGLVAAARWVAGRDAAMQDAARRHFEAAQTLLSPGQDLRFARKLRAAYETTGLAIPEELAEARLTVN